MVNFCGPLTGLLLVTIHWASLVAQRLKSLPTVRETRVQSLGWEDPLAKGMATHSSILAWRIPWMGEPGRLQHRVHRVTKSQTRLSDFTHSFTHSLYISLLSWPLPKVCHYYFNRSWKKSEVQRCQLLCPRTHSYETVKKSGLSDCRTYALFSCCVQETILYLW